MPVRSISYDFHRERDDWRNDRNLMLAYIKRTWPWAKISESNYAIETTLTTAQVMTRLRRFMDSNDTVYVITLTAPWSGFGPEPVNIWLTERLGPAS